MALGDKRILWIDTTKALAILLVIIGHSVTGPVRAVIFSFHMPLFFILSAYTTRFSKNREEILLNCQKGFKHLILPAFLVFIVRSTISLLSLISKTGEQVRFEYFVTGKVLSLLFSSGIECYAFGMRIPALGIPWFLVVLFFSRLIYDFLQVLSHNRKSVLAVCSILLSCVGVILGQRIFLFFSFDIVLAVVSLYLVAQIVKDNKYLEKCTFIKTSMFLIVWIVCFCIPYLVMPLGEKRYLELASRDYPVFPVCFIGAISATFFMAEVSVIINNRVSRKMMNAVNVIGKNSLYMLCIHCFDNYWKVFYSLTENMYINAFCRVLIDVAVFYILMIIKSRKEGYRLFKN